MIAGKILRLKRRRRKDVSLAMRALVRTSAVVGLYGVMGYSVMVGQATDDPNNPLYNIKGRVAAHYGYAAQDIAVSGLSLYTPGDVLGALGIKPNDSLIGFSAPHARAVLEKVDWIRAARVRRIYPNRLEIDIVERRPFAIWQRDGEAYVIDKDGGAFTTLEPRDVKGLVVVTGEGANKHVFEIVNHLEAHAGVKSKIAALGRVGNRRWNIYLQNGTVIKLPAKNVPNALNLAFGPGKRFALSDRQVGVMDLRLAGQMIVETAAAAQNETETGVTKVNTQ